MKIQPPRESTVFIIHYLIYYLKWELNVKILLRQLLFLYIYFFSSRRRHTRLVSDWSSDVCSSDLMRRHTRLVSDWSSDVCSSDPSELQSLTNLVCRLLLGEKKATKLRVLTST